MAGWGRDTPWRQGSVLPEDGAKALGLLSGAPRAKVAVVVSHDCDLAQDPSVEPVVEVIVGRRIGAADGNLSYAKNARRLHLTFSGGRERLTADLVARRKIPIKKERLAEYEPVETTRLTVVEHTILQRWLAARYRRAAFPDEFDKRLEDTGLRDRLGRILKSFGASISAMYFDVDQGEEVFRFGSDDPYTLGVYLLFSTEIDPEVAEKEANTAKAAIRKAFRDKCLSTADGTWHNIELVECEAISDQAMTIGQAEKLKKWSADHISLRMDTPQSMLSNE
jgi:hypothetical protein